MNFKRCGCCGTPVDVSNIIKPRVVDRDGNVNKTSARQVGGVWCAVIKCPACKELIFYDTGESVKDI